MATAPRSFEDDQTRAAKLFAQTMIFVDDRAYSSSGHTITASAVSKPTARKRVVNTDTAEKTATPAKPDKDIVKNSFDAQKLTENAMDNGLVCSVLNPSHDEGAANRVATAAERADIICLDWEMNDDGELACDIVRQILESDKKKNGRIRLVAIYSAQQNDVGARMDKLAEVITDVYDVIVETEHNDFVLKTKNGIRIAWLVKGKSVKGDPLSDFKVSEEDLPKRLQMEFGKLSNGLLSNLSLALIAAIRDCVHHVIGKFHSGLDAPYLHHRAKIGVPDEAVDYAIGVIFSEIRSSTDKRGVADKFANDTAISRRIRAILDDAAPELTVEDKKRPIPVADIEKIVQMGEAQFQSTVQGVKPKHVASNVAVLLSTSPEQALEDTLQFKSLTEVAAHPGSFMPTWIPTLGLGTILKSRQNEFYLCLQASCDSIRLKRNTTVGFLFVKLTEAPKGPGMATGSEKPDHVVPIFEGDLRTFTPLKLADKAYQCLHVIDFTTKGAQESIRAQALEDGSRGYEFEDATGKRYSWVANLKHRRALRVVQDIARDMARLGIDEFEPLRK